MNRLVLDINTSRYIVIDIKNNRYRKPFLVSILVSGKKTEHVDDNLQRFCSDLVKAIKENPIITVYTYSAKNLFKSLLHFCSAEDVQEIIPKIKDISLYLFDIYGKNTDLFYSTLLHDIDLDIEAEPQIFQFYRHNAGLDVTPYELIDIEVVKKLSENQIRVIESIVFTLTLNEKKYISLYTLASYYYAELELTGISIDKEAMKSYTYEDISRYFIGLCDGDEKAYIEYNFTNSSTGRLSSKFHNFQKSMFGDILIPSEQNGILMALDFQCFEFKTLLYYLGLEYKDHDPYSYIADKVGLTRKVVKNNMIKFIYGSAEVDYRIANEIDSVFDLGKKLRAVVDKAVEDKCIETPYGKTILYSDENEIRRKAVNNIIQNISSYISIYTFCFLQSMLKSFKSSIIATVYDEIIIDVNAEEHDGVLDALDLLRTIPILQNKYVNFTFGINTGRSFSELEK